MLGVDFGPGNFHVHQWITKPGISNEFADKESLTRIYEENRETDKDDVRFNDSSLHFDSEKFTTGAQKLAANLNDAVEHLSICKKEEAVVYIGEALHALQDFYSHSNRVENHLFDRDTVVPSDIPICTQLITLGAGGQFVPGSLAPDPGFQPVCDPDPGPPTVVVTSGYSPDDTTPTTPTRKCSHKQMNKDWDGGALSPRGAFVVNGSPLYEFAYDVARRHTQALWQDFKQAFILRYGQEQGQDYYNILINKQINVAFTLDVSASMEEELPAVKAKVIEWVNDLLANPIAPKLSLVTFTTSIESDGTTCSPSEFLGWVNALSAEGGSGCGESSITAALRAADMVGKDGVVVLATDEAPDGAAVSVRPYTARSRSRFRYGATTGDIHPLSEPGAQATGRRWSRLTIAPTGGNPCDCSHAVWGCASHSGWHGLARCRRDRP